MHVPVDTLEVRVDRCAKVADYGKARVLTGRYEALSLFLGN